jgi:protein-L-isoaspartate(D-aspartate) O-methyltransferase
MADLAELRARMVERQLWRRGIHDRRVLAAMGEVPREEFVPAERRRSAYADSALPIGGGQTISQPWVVAAICQALELEGSERVLEVGTGSGYSAAVLARLASEVIGIERHEPLARGAAAALARVGADNVRVLLGDGSRGYPAEAPYEAIAVHASAPAAPPALIGQLAEAGRLVVPIAGPESDDLTLLRRTPAGVEATPLAPCRFVPLIGEQGF